MIASWMLYTLLVSVLIAAAAWVMEEACRLLGLAVRFVWLGALLATVGLAAAAPLRVSAPDPRGATAAFALPGWMGGAADHGAPARLSPLGTTLAAARAAVARPLRAAAAWGAGAAGRLLAAGWIALSLTLSTFAAATLLRSRGVRRGWPLREIAGTTVRVAPATGPAVLGIRHPEVVVPRWLLDASAEEQRLVVLHERAHVRARDPLVLAAGCLSVALLPWSPAVGWMLLRLRLAVEIDCDARVLRGGVHPYEYGSVLIDMAGRGPGLSLGVPALAGSPSSLERRLCAMTTRLPRFAALRAGALGALAVAALLAACDTRMPTGPEIEAMDVTAAEAQGKNFGIASKDGQVTYFVDGKQVSAEEARALGGDKIARMEMVRAQVGEGVIFHIATREGTPGEEDRVRVTENILLETPGKGKHIVYEATQAGGKKTQRLLPAGEFPGLLFVDGVLTQPSRMRTLNPDDVATIKVIKGPAATRMYDDPKAAQGVIRVTTKAGASSP